MLTKIWVDGFRSLNDFTFEPKPGLNVLVGANGAGKTNIIDFLKFVSLLRAENLNDAVKKTDDIFSRFYENKDTMQYKIWGVRFGKEYFEEVAITIFDLGIIISNLLVFFDKEEVFNLKKDLRQFSFINNKNHYLTEMEHSINFKYKAHYLDINFNTPYNFKPELIKEFDKIGSEPIITSEGEGLHAFLYSLQSNTKNENLLEKIQTHFSYLRDDIVKFEVEKNDDFKKFITYAFFKKGEETVKVPISHLSDGTVKWLALVAAIMACQNDFIIDEPENFIHPELHSLMIELLRERMEETGGIAVIATHSETILNAVKPEEMIIVTMDEGKTKAMPVENTEHFKKVINETNFGMGHIYLTGWLK